MTFWRCLSGLQEHRYAYILTVHTEEYPKFILASTIFNVLHPIPNYQLEFQRVSTFVLICLQRWIILVLIKSCWQSYILRTFPFKHETRLLSIIYFLGIFQNLPLPTHFYANQNIFLQIWWKHMVSINFLSLFEWYQGSACYPCFVEFWRLYLSYIFCDIS